MIHSIEIKGYRALNNFSLENLGRINLIVGKNNTGKTSILEALNLLLTRSEPAVFWNTIARRGEQLSVEMVPGRPFQPEMDARHIFFGHSLSVGQEIQIRATNQKHSHSILFKVKEARPEQNPALYAQFQPSSDDGRTAPRLAIEVTGNPSPVTSLVPLTSRGGLRNDIVQMLSNIAVTSARSDNSSVFFVPTESLSISYIQSAFNELVLSPREEYVTKAIKFLEPRVERIALFQPATISFQLGQISRGGFKVKLKDQNDPVPIGSLGDGTWRMLSLAIAISQCKDGVLLIDEIDAGLHYSAMDNMWKFVENIAKDINAQVFATTHSQDCVRSLATICNDTNSEAGQISIQRIDADKKRAVSYSPKEIVNLREFGIEARG